jgi:enoyl-CoA hydratase
MGLIVEKEGGVARVTMDRPEALNAMDLDMSLGLAETWEELAVDDAVRVIVLTGTGDRAFCAGADLKTLLPLITSGGFQEGVGATGNVFLKSVPLYKPIVARVNGDAIAGGTELLQATDLRVAVEGARFGLQEVKWGLFPAGGSTVRLAQQIPYCHAMEILLTGRLLTAAEALAVGLVNRVVPPSELDDVVEKWVSILLRNGPFAQQRVKQSVLSSFGRPLPEALRIEAEIAQEVFRTEDAVEGPRSFVEKREPVFKGR